MKINKVIIGMEVHVELTTRSKMFCGCLAEHFARQPNTQTCPVCLGLPGALPVPNKKAIESTILLGLAFGGEIQSTSRFDRKNYFYPDLPKGYQISQYDHPFILKGNLTLKSGKKIRIRRVHLEEDTGKLMHQIIEGERCTLVDYNRSGVPLVEIVSEPDICSSDEVKEYLEKVQRFVRYLGIANADMEKGSMRCEPNVNLEIEDEGKIYYTPIAELKNINSFRFAQKAVEFEIKRQFEEFRENRVEKTKGNKQTRGWDENKQATVLQRQKEEANDYRYFPEPDIPPIKWSDEELKNFELRIKNYELPDKKRDRFIKDYGLSDYQAEILTDNKDVARYFEMCVKAGKCKNILPLEIANVIINKRAPADQNPDKLIEYILSSKAKIDITEEDLGKLIDRLTGEHPEAVKAYEAGKPQALGLIVGLVKKETGIIVTLDKIIERVKK